MGFVNPKFKIVQGTEQVERMKGGPYENNEERQYYTVTRDVWVVTCQDNELIRLYSLGTAEQWLENNCTVPGIKKTFNAIRKDKKKAIRELEAEIALLDKDEKDVLQQRVNYLTVVKKKHS